MATLCVYANHPNGLWVIGDGVVVVLQPGWLGSGGFSIFSVT